MLSTVKKFFLILLLLPNFCLAGLIGDEVTLVWEVPTASYSTTLIAKEGVDLSDLIDFDIKDYSIEAKSPYPGLGAGVVWKFLDLDVVGTGGGIASVMVQTNYGGWSDDFLSYGDDYIQVSFLNFMYFSETDNYFEMFITPVPEPSSYALLLAGLGLLFLAKRKKA